MSELKNKALYVRVGQSSKTNKKYYQTIFINHETNYQCVLAFIDKDKVAELLDISPRKVAELQCKDYEVL